MYDLMAIQGPFRLSIQCRDIFSYVGGIRDSPSTIRLRDSGSAFDFLGRRLRQIVFVLRKHEVFLLFIARRDTVIDQVFQEIIHYRLLKFDSQYISDNSLEIL